MRAVGFRRLLGAMALVVVFNALAIWAVLASSVPAEPWVFTAWFVGDILIGSIALGLTDPA